MWALRKCHTHQIAQGRRSNWDVSSHHPRPSSASPCLSRSGLTGTSCLLEWKHCVSLRGGRKIQYHITLHFCGHKYFIMRVFLLEAGYILLLYEKVLRSDIFFIYLKYCYIYTPTQGYSYVSQRLSWRYLETKLGNVFGTAKPLKISGGTFPPTSRAWTHLVKDSIWERIVRCEPEYPAVIEKLRNIVECPASRKFVMGAKNKAVTDQPLALRIRCRIAQKLSVGWNFSV